jgi:hypothetical protein
MPRLTKFDRVNQVKEAKRSIVSVMSNGDDNDKGELLEVFMMWRYASICHMSSISGLDIDEEYLKWRQRFGDFETAFTIFNENIKSVLEQRDEASANAEDLRSSYIEMKSSLKSMSKFSLLLIDYTGTLMDCLEKFIEPGSWPNNPDIESIISKGLILVRESKELCRKAIK